MAKPIQYVIELNKEEAEVFMNDFFNRKPNPARDRMVERAKNTNFTIK